MAGSETTEALNAKLRTLKAVAFDVDGTLTDGTISWSATGEESKTFSFKDVMGVSLLRRLGITMALISGEATPQVDRFATRMHIPFVVKGTRDKAGALREFAAKHGLALEHICFFGDDVNDLPAMEIAGMCACPGDAVDEVSRYVMERYVSGQGVVGWEHGGNGAVREFVDRLLAARGLSGRDVFQMKAV